MGFAGTLQRPLHQRDDASVLSWVPSAGIDWDVIYEDLPLYLGAGSSVERANHPKDGRPGYYVRSPNNTLTVAMITDLKRDTIDWQEERAKKNNRDYRKSETHNRRQGPTRPSQLPVTKRDTSSPQRPISSPRKRARSTFFAASGFLGEVVASALIHNYRPLRDRGITETWFTRHLLPTSTLENIPTSGPLLKQTWRCVSNSLRRGILLPRVRDFVREPGPTTFVISCAVFTLCLVHLMQHTSHHRYQNTFILCGTSCGVLIGVFTASHGVILVSAVTAYLPVSIIVAQVLSLLVHTILLSCSRGEE